MALGGYLARLTENVHRAQKQGTREPAPTFPPPDVPPAMVTGAGNARPSFRTLIAGKDFSILAHFLAAVEAARTWGRK